MSSAGMSAAGMSAAGMSAADMSAAGMGAAGMSAAGMGAAGMSGAAGSVSSAAGMGGSAGAAGATAACMKGADGQCVIPAEPCKGHGGSAVCDAAGTLVSCNLDETIDQQQMCPSVRLCEVGLPARTCAMCLPKLEFRCTEKTLEVCADDGLSFVKHDECETAALCNTLAGMCTSAVCSPDKFACDGNTLTKCNASGTAFESQTPCMERSCDAAGGDCDRCQPGHKTCMGDMVMTCDAKGQGYTASACPNGNRCIGPGQCVACASDNDCAGMTQGCKVGACSQANLCSTKDAPDGTACMAASARPGTCSAGQCLCTPMCTDKECGDDGCGTGRMCPSRCSRTQRCSNFECVDCTSSSECPASNDVCLLPACMGGMCGTTNAPSTTRCTTAAGSGTCRDGKCAVCTPSCAAGTCGEDGCGGQCKCSGSDHCIEGRCVQCGTGVACPPSMVCTSEGRCETACGNGEIDTAVGENCDWKAEGWNDWTCDTSSCRTTGASHTAFQACNPGSNACSPSEECMTVFGTYHCYPRCGSAACIPPTGYSMMCYGDQVCVVTCNPGKCPPGTECKAIETAQGVCE
jgi:hypothetical protein